MRQLLPALVAVCVGAGALAVPAAASDVDAPPRTAAASAPSNAASVPVVSAAEATAPRKLKRKAVRRSYGQGPVRTVPGRKYALVFSGRTGDRVRVSPGDERGQYWFQPGKSRLVSPSGRTVKIGVSGFARLPRTGTYRFHFTTYADRVQLVKQVLRKVEPGKTVAERARRGYQYAVEVRVPGTGVRHADFGVEPERLLLHGESIYTDESTSLDGYALLSPGLAYQGTRFKAGDVLRVFLPLGAGARATARDLGQRTMSLDGPSIDLPRSTRAGSTFVVKVDKASTEGLPGGFLDVLIADAEGRTASPSPGNPHHRVGWTVSAFGADGHFLESYQGLVRVPSPQDVTLLLGKFSTATGTTARLTTLAVHDEQVVVGGERVRVPVPADGRRVLVPVRDQAEDRGHARLVVDGAPAGLWQATAGMLTSPAYPVGCNGCGESDQTSLTELGTSTLSFYLGRAKPWVLLEAQEGQRTGEFSVGLVRRVD